MGSRANRVIRGKCSSEGINQIIDGLRAYQSGLKRATEIFARRLGEEGFDVAQIYIAQATDTADPDKPIGTLDIMTDTNGFISSVRLKFSGAQVLFVEFGAGITYNSGNPNPWSGEFGMGVGTYPKQVHAYDESGWGYLGDDDRFHHTFGTEATMPMYHASQAVRQKDLVVRIAKEVFGSVI